MIQRYLRRSHWYLTVYYNYISIVVFQTLSLVYHNVLTCYNTDFGMYFDPFVRQ